MSSAEPEESPEKKPALRPIKEKVEDFGTFTVLINPDGMEAYISVQSPTKELCALLVEEILESAKIIEGIMPAEIEAFCRIALSEKVSGKDTYGPHLIARGTTMMEGTNGRLDYRKRPSEPRLTEEQGTDKVDHREANPFDNIKNGDTLALLVPTKAGISGVDVFGKPIPAPKVFDCQVVPGDHVTFEAETGTFTATGAGHMVQRHNTLSILPVYEVTKNLDMRHGNIRFAGPITVKKDILDDFSVTATEDINIGGTIEACTLVSGGNITCQGGVTGKGRGTIQAKGSVKARYLNEANIICNGDVIIEKEIVNSRVHCLGKVTVKTGNIMGSEVVALRGIQTRNGGSEIGSKTTLAAGLHYKAFNRLRQLDSKLVELLNKQKVSLARLKKWLDAAAEGEQVESRRHRQIEIGVKEAREEDKQITVLSKETSEIRKSFDHLAIPCISIEQMLFESVVLITGMFERENHEKTKGPLSFLPDQHNRTPKRYKDLLTAKLWNEEVSLSELIEANGGIPTTNVTLSEVEELYTAYAARADTLSRKNRTVLVAEDQTNMRLLLVRQLDKAGYDVLEAENGREVLAHLLKKIPDCCLLDINMPLLDGFGALKAMRANERFAKIPVLMCTAQNDRNSIITAHKLGSAGYIIKPYQVKQVIEKVGQVISEAEAAACPEKPNNEKNESSQ